MAPQQPARPDMIAVEEDAITSETDRQSNQEGQLDCPICLDSHAPAAMHTLGDCLHCFCSACLDGHIKVKLQEHVFPVPCPGINCPNHISVQECQVVLRSPTLLEQLLRVSSLPTVPSSLSDGFASAGPMPHLDCTWCSRRQAQGKAHHTSAWLCLGWHVRGRIQHWRMMGSCVAAPLATCAQGAWFPSTPKRPQLLPSEVDWLLRLLKAIHPAMHVDVADARLPAMLAASAGALV